MTTKPIPHERIRADLKAFADGELSPLARFFLSRHLRSCPSCREELIQMQTLSTELQESEPESAPLPSDLRASILENAPTTEADSLLEEEVTVRRRVNPKKAVFLLGTCSVAALLFITISTGGKVKNTFNKAADSMTAADDVGSSSSTSTGGVINGPLAGSVLKAVPQSSDRSSAVVAGAASAVANRAQNSIGNNAIFSDGHVKDETTHLDRATLRAVPSAAQEQANAVSSANGAVLSSTSGISGDLSSVIPTNRAVHREGSLAVAVQNAESASEDATNILKNAGGFIANTSLETGAGQSRTAVLDCRVPVDQFEVVVKKIGALGIVRSKSLSGKDITAQVAQSGARRQTLAQEYAIAQARLDQKEKSRKPNAADLYELRAEVRTLRIQASQARAALETLQKYGSLSSLYVSLQDGLPATATPRAAGWFDSLSPTSQAAWTSFLSNARVPLQLFLWILAYSPFWVPALIIWRKYGRKWLTD